MKLVRNSSINYAPASHESVSNPGVLKKVLLHADELQIGKVQMVNWAELKPQRSFGNHYHEDMQEVFVMISDGVEAIVNNEVIHLNAGDALIVDANEHHVLRNTTTKSVHYIVFGISGNRMGKTISI